MDADGHYENLQLQQRDDAVYEDLNTRPTPRPMPPDIRRYKRVGGGLLCAVLALISIAVPVYLCQSCTVEREQLVNKINQSLDRINNLTRERDDMKMRLCESAGWQKFDRGCYYMSTEEKTWDQGRQWCTDRNSDLIVIKSKEKQDFVANFNKRVWLGLTDRDTEGSFQWVDGTPLTTPTGWRPNEPQGESKWNPNAEEDCVEYYDGSESDAPNRGWDDRRCSVDVRYWMCERAVC